MNSRPNAGPSRLVVSLVVGLVVLLVVIVLLSRAFGAAPVETRTATPAPSFALKIGPGKFIKLNAFKDKALIVCFFATGDAPSKREAIILNDLLKEHSETNLAVLGLVLEQPAQRINAFVEEQGVGFPLYPPDYDIIQGFGGLTAVPTLFIIDKNQNIIRKYVGVAEASALEADLKAIFKQ
jgi:peroxiredoxin